MQAQGTVMARANPLLEHVLRRAGFGMSAADLAAFDGVWIPSMITHLVDYERIRTTSIRRSAVRTTSASRRAGAFSPNTNIEHARQRWLFRMVHSQRPLQEKMALFWHNHFATALQQGRLATPARRRAPR